MFSWLRNLFTTTEPEVVNYLKGKTVTENGVGFAPKTESVEVKAVKVKKADLSKLTKDKLEAFAKENYKVDIDKRKKKVDLVNEVFKLSKK